MNNFNANAQETNKIVEPEYIGVFFRCNPTNGNLVSLEREIMTERTHVNFLGFAGGEALAEMDGEKSPIRFKNNEKLEFVVKLASQENDPQTQISFYSCKTVKGKRQMILAKAGAFSGGKNTSEESAIPYNAEKYGQSSFKFSSISDLPPGEYLLGVKGVAGAYCFGVDSAEQPSPNNSEVKTNLQKQ